MLLAVSFVEKFDHVQQFIAHQNRETDSAMQSGANGFGVSNIVRVQRSLPQHERRSRCEDATGKSFADRKRGALGCVGKFRELTSTVGPDLAAPQNV